MLTSQFVSNELRKAFSSGDYRRAGKAHRRISLRMALIPRSPAADDHRDDDLSSASEETPLHRGKLLALI